MNTLYAVIHGSYSTLQLGIFNNDICIAQAITDDMRASSYLLKQLDHLLHANNLSINNLDYIIVDNGPGAFTSLRVTIATVNGIGYALNKPLVAVSGLHALLLDAHDNTSNYRNVILLNAYNNDVYYAFESDNATEPIIGCSSIQALPDLLHSNNDKQLSFAGNAALMHKAFILEHFPTACFIDNLQVASLTSIAKLGRTAWQHTAQHTNQIEPLYLKTQLFAIKN